MPEPQIFRDHDGGRIEVKKGYGPMPLILASDAAGAAVRFGVESECFPGFIEALFAAAGEQVLIVQDSDASMDTYPFADGEVGYDPDRGDVWVNFTAGNMGRFEPDVAVEVGTRMVAFGRRAQAAEAEIAGAVSDMANDMADMPWAPMDEPGRRELAAAMVRAGYGRRPADA